LLVAATEVWESRIISSHIGKGTGESKAVKWGGGGDDTGGATSNQLSESMF